MEWDMFLPADLLYGPAIFEMIQSDVFVVAQPLLGAGRSAMHRIQPWHAARIYQFQPCWCGAHEYDPGGLQSWYPMLCQPKTGVHATTALSQIPTGSTQGITDLTSPGVGMGQSYAQGV